MLSARCTLGRRVEVVSGLAPLGKACNRSARLNRGRCARYPNSRRPHRTARVASSGPRRQHIDGRVPAQHNGVVSTLSPHGTEAIYSDSSPSVSASWRSLLEMAAQSCDQGQLSALLRSLRERNSADRSADLWTNL
ncbi:hypothetical protein MRX96_009698 [Rhipicephalus microplus]